MNPPEKIVLASGNAGKLKEFAGLFASLKVDVESQAALNVSEVPEKGLTFIENALIKARNASRQTGLPAIADDSGLSVPSLGGAPGIYSARYSIDVVGEDQVTDLSNNDKLLEAMRGLEREERRAAFTCCLVYLATHDDPLPIIALASWQGEILEQPFGEGGFGYDPLFFVPSEGVAAAQLDKNVKNRISHRGQATAIFLQKFRQRYQCV